MTVDDKDIMKLFDDASASGHDESELLQRKALAMSILALRNEIRKSVETLALLFTKRSY